MKKNYLLVLLIIMFSGLSVIKAQEDFTIDKISYRITSDNTVEITSKTTATGNVNIPDTVTHNNIDYQVTAISYAAFSKNDLTGVYIPDSVTSIGDYAFYENELMGVTIGKSVKTIGYNAFFENKLTSVDIPDSVVTIDRYAFSSNNLTSVDIPDSVVTIGASAFSSNKLMSVDIPDSVVTIGRYAFSNNNLTSVDIPDSVETIGYGVFQNNALTSIDIPDSVTSIGTSAFSYNALTTVTIGNSVVTIGSWAFSNNNNLETVISESNASVSISENTFGIRSNIDLIIPWGDGVLQAYANAGWTGFKSITQDDDTLSIGDVILNNQDVRLLVKNNQMRIVTEAVTQLKRYSIYSLIGKLVLRGNQDTVSIAELSDGIYIASLTFDNGLIINKKFAK